MKLSAINIDIHENWSIPREVLLLFFLTPQFWNLQNTCRSCSTDKMNIKPKDNTQEEHTANNAVCTPAVHQRQTNCKRIILHSHKSIRQDYECMSRSKMNAVWLACFDKYTFVLRLSLLSEVVHRHRNDDVGSENLELWPTRELEGESR